MTFDRIHKARAVANERFEQIQRPDNVHFTSGGSKVLAERVVKSILDVLK